MSLCRHYVREMRRSVLLETPELEKASSKRVSAALDEFDLRDNRGRENASMRSERTQDQRVSQILREQADDSPSKPKLIHNDSSGSDKSSPSQHPALRRGSPPDGQPRPSGLSRYSDQAGGESSSPNDASPHHTVERRDIRDSAEKILYTFLLPGAERQIILPGGMVEEIEDAIDHQGRDDPEMFDAAKDYVFQAMERDAFPGFLRSKALGNLIPLSLMVRLILGLLAIFGGLWAAFVLVFTDRSRGTRAWVCFPDLYHDSGLAANTSQIILPMLIGVYLLASHQYTVDPLLGFAGYSEYTFCSFTRVKEPFVRRLLVMRATILSAFIFLITAAVCCLFIFVPGVRL